MAGTIDLGEVRLNTRQAQRNLEALNSKIDDSAKKIEEASNAGSGLDSLKNAFDTLKTGVAGGVAAYTALIAASTNYAIIAERNAVAVRGLGAGFQAIRAATNDAMSAQTAFAAQNQITQSGLRISSDQLAILARAAREFALRTGTDSAQAMQQLSAAIVSGDAQALRPFGVSVMQGTLRTQALRQALTQLSAQQQSSINPARTLAEETERLSRSWDTFRDSMAQSVSQALDLKTAISDIATVLEDFARGGNLARDALNELAQAWLGVNAVTRNQTQQGRQIAARESATAFLTAAQSSSRPLDLTGFNINQIPNDQIENFDRDIRATTTQAEMQAVVGRYIGIASRSTASRARAVQESRANASNPARGGTSDRDERLRGMSLLDRRQLAEDQRQARQSLRILLSDMQQMGYRFTPRFASEMNRLINGFLDPAARQEFEHRMAAMSRTVADEQRIRGIASEEDSRRIGLAEYEYGSGGENRAEWEERNQVMSGMGRLTGDGSETLAERFGYGLSNEQYRNLAESERDKAQGMAEMNSASAARDRRGNFREQIETFFSDTQTLAEKGAKGVEAAFGTMTQGVTGFVDALIEGQVPAGEAAVGLAKAVLKGIAMQAIPEALFETAKGFAALATGNPRAALHFTAAGIYAGVAVAAGAGAAAIGAAQRAGSQPSASLPAGGGPGLPSGIASNERGSVVFNINSTVFDPERAEETVSRLMRGANQRGL